MSSLGRNTFLSPPKLGEVSRSDGGVCTLLHVQIGAWHNINAYNSIRLFCLPDTNRTGIPFYRTATKKQARGIDRELACLFCYVPLTSCSSAGRGFRSAVSPLRWVRVRVRVRAREQVLARVLPLPSSSGCSAWQCP